MLARQLDEFERKFGTHWTGAFGQLVPAPHGDSVILQCCELRGRAFKAQREDIRHVIWRELGNEGVNMRRTCYCLRPTRKTLPSHGGNAIVVGVAH